MSDPQVPDPQVVRDAQAHPWVGFALAADAAVCELSEHVPMDLWLVTHVAGPDQRVIASHGDWDSLAAPGTVFPWKDSFCIRMVDGERGLAPDVQDVPLYQQAAVGPYAIVRCYIGVPLVGADGLLFGTLCGFAGTTRPQLGQSYDLVRFVGRMLSTVLTGEATTAQRSDATADAYAQLARDALTGLANFRGWQRALAVEQERCRRFGSPASVITVTLAPDLHTQPDREPTSSAGAGDVATGSGPDWQMTTAAAALAALCQPTDTAARITSTRLAMIAVGADVVSARALVTSLRLRLRSSTIRVFAGAASRRTGEDLQQTWQRAHRTEL